MSADEEDEPGLPGAVRTVSDAVGLHPNAEMNAIGLLMGAILVVLIIPLLPFVVLVWLISRGADLVRGQGGGA